MGAAVVQASLLARQDLWPGHGGERAVELAQRCCLVRTAPPGCMPRCTHALETTQDAGHIRASACALQGSALTRGLPVAAGQAWGPGVAQGPWPCAACPRWAPLAGDPSLRAASSCPSPSCASWRGACLRWPPPSACAPAAARQGWMHGCDSPCPGPAGASPAAAARRLEHIRTTLPGVCQMRLRSQLRQSCPLAYRNRWRRPCTEPGRVPSARRAVCIAVAAHVRLRPAQVTPIKRSTAAAAGILPQPSVTQPMQGTGSPGLP